MVIVLQRSLVGGELAPALYARTDLAKYSYALRTMRNFFPGRHGGAYNRPGTVFVGEVKDSTKRVRLLKFVFNSDQTYILEFGNQYMRVIRNGAQVTESPKTITGATQANPCVVTSAGHGFSNGDEVFISGVGGMTELNGRNFKVANVTANTFELVDMGGTPLNSTAFGAYTTGGTAARVYTISTPYVEADLPDLAFVQSADVITIVHRSYQPRELSRSGHSSWTLATISFAPAIAAPGSFAVSGSAGDVDSWKVTAVASESFEESLPTAAVGSDTVASSGSPRTLSWNEVAGARAYNVYKRQIGQADGVYGYLGTVIDDGASTFAFVDNGITPDLDQTPPEARDPFSGAGNYPGAVAHYKGRRGFAGTTNDPEKVWFSRVGAFKNFSIRTPIQDDDPVTFRLAGSQVNEVRHLLELGILVPLTSGGEWSVQGDSAGILTPTAINARQHSYNGAARLRPLTINGNAVYAQARGGIVRDLAYELDSDGYRGTDLTLFASHLFTGRTISDWDFQQIPHSIIWAVRDDGVLLGCTYLREHQILAWHRHTFRNGTVENVCVVPEGQEDAVYLTVKRTINGRTVRYIERLDSRTIADVVDAIFLDCSLSYDGRNTDAGRTMTLSGGTLWNQTELLTLTCSASFFSAAEVDNEIHLTAADGTIVRCRITAYTSPTVVTVRPNRTVPTDLRAAATSSWARAVDVLAGLWHLEGQKVSVLGDGFVAGNPLNPKAAQLTVTSGSITLDRCYAVAHVGLPITADLYTLDIDTVEGETMVSKKKLVNQLTLFLEDSRGGWVGPQPPTDDDTDALEGLQEIKLRQFEGYDDPVALKTGSVTENMSGSWNDNGRVFVRQIDPLPMAVLAIAPSGVIPFRG